MKLKRQDTFTIKDPISLRTASRESGVHYLLLRRYAIAGAFTAQRLGGWYWFVSRASFERWLAERRRTRSR